jgi:UDP-2-acetamido-2,6-beta-L-arabino-hexul-4-ose reductase
MRAAVTGAHGFLGWHLRARLRALRDGDTVALGREELSDPDRLAAALTDVDVVFHLAGVNRAETDHVVEHQNVEIARRLASAVAMAASPVHIVYGNTIQSDGATPYGRGKRRAGVILAEAAAQTGGTLADVPLPNLFGEHGRPHYNSFVATFCSEVAHGREPVVTGDRQIPLLHAQEAADALITAAERREDHRVTPQGEPHAISEVLASVKGFHNAYSRGQIPLLPDGFSVDLFNTYRSYVFPDAFPFRVEVSADERGELFEAVRAQSTASQVFASTTQPGMTRGEHFHLRKIERFFVVKGTATIALRRVLTDEVVRFQVKGEDRSFVDMPTLWVHNITNVGDDELITLFWADQLLDPAAPDTYRESVKLEGEQP